jgi:hypothetical protein
MASSISAPFLAQGWPVRRSDRGSRGAKGFAMFVRHYRLLLALAASLSLALAGCGLQLATEYPSTAGAPKAQPAPVPVATAPVAAAPVQAGPPAARSTTAKVASLDPYGTDQTIWTVLGLAKRDSQRNIGPETGNTVSPILWQAAMDTLSFAGNSSEDPLTGVIVSNWYSPPAKPNERLKVSVFILSRALRSDSLSVTVDRQVRSPGGGWSDAPISREAVADLENAVLLRARQIHAERYRNEMYN